MRSTNIRVCSARSKMTQPQSKRHLDRGGSARSVAQPSTRSSFKLQSKSKSAIAWEQQEEISDTKK